MKPMFEVPKLAPQRIVEVRPPNVIDYFSMNPQSLIEVNPQKMSGTPVFRGTRVPIQNLFDCLEDGETIDQFLDQFPTVTKEQVNGILELSKERLLEGEVAA
jgi:uncharacterized protein (DUF433 family)